MNMTGSQSIVQLLFIIGQIILAGSSCPDGWLRHDSTCYHFSHDSEPWAFAFQICEIIGGNLLQIDSAEENAYIAGQISSRGSNYLPYMALSDLAEENVWVWMVSGSHLKSTSYSNWLPGQPDNAGANENCGEMRQGGQWNDLPCTVPRPYICEKLDEDGVDIVG